ncbi:toxic anion resistance protein [Loigolactobacillus backii]|uniref:Tellurite resistance protein TelA n=1 Tax=Loigolactobacillus backii TaxID=375175 RepID=A0A192H4J3_9LACO|nr:toxic anion resistance protein [Loigolactobacillus backii]ANK59731.1 tellurite resistance protein TelA [Loigolactobacillus backii]ANK63132.1 tellurite resistance protein TelA [Loigolactobacillus backii]ANK64726.1 tellurite resistance protein TelA [Loigolactobacillus backii]ANK66825.1 tellurite resistance protein TelA [Loigolactobacillus backii]ANK69860.1 tellurite resistance protein TelA [Loigolactobacillus backii]
MSDIEKKPTKNAEKTDLLENLLQNPLETPTNEVSQAQPEQANQLVDRLPEEQQQEAQKLAQQISVDDVQSIMNYGAQAQKKLGEFSQGMLSKVQSQDTGAIGDALSDLMYRLNESSPEELKSGDSNVFKRMFGRVKKSIYETQAKYQKIGAQIDQIAVKLDKQKNNLTNDNRLLEQLYTKNKDYFDALNIYIAAGELKLNETKTTLLPAANKKAQTSGNQMDVQAVNDLTQFDERLDKRIYDLKLAREITIQQAPQIRLIQNTNQVLAEKIQSSINTAIPLWKNQVAVALTLLRQRDAVTAQRQVSETTNDLLKKNSEMLKVSSIETAKENERGVVDIETLQKTQNDLVETLQETLKIQQEGREKRQNAELELSTMENNLRDQLLALTNQHQNPDA